MEKVKLDKTTAAWFKDKPSYTVTTMVQCKKCGLFYKPSLGHKCKAKEDGRMKTFKVIAQVEVEVTANSEAEAYEKAHREITFGTDVYFDSDGLVSIEEMEG